MDIVVRFMHSLKAAAEIDTHCGKYTSSRLENCLQPFASIKEHVSALKNFNVPFAGGIL